MLNNVISKCCKSVNNVIRSESREVLLEEDNVLNYNLNKVIGKGKFGIVYLAFNKINNKNYAIKKSIKQNKLFSTELYFMRKFKHSSLIVLHESFIYDNYHYLVIDYYKDGDLFTYIKNVHDFDVDITRKIILNLLRPLLYLKQYKLAHLDIKPENFLVRNISGCDFVLSDFGCMQEYKEYNREYKLKHKVGTKNYAAPELYNLVYNSKSDVWSLGQIILILISGNMIEYKDEYTQLDIYDLLRGLKINKRCFSLLKKCFSIDYKNRINLEDIIDDKWIEEYYLGHL